MEFYSSSPPFSLFYLKICLLPKALFWRGKGSREPKNKIHSLLRKEVNENCKWTWKLSSSKLDLYFHPGCYYRLHHSIRKISQKYQCLAVKVNCYRKINESIKYKTNIYLIWSWKNSHSFNLKHFFHHIDCPKD